MIYGRLINAGFSLYGKANCTIQIIVLYLLYNFEAIHNKDYSVVKTFKAAFTGRFHFLE
ncbi:hypothetical protein SAMN05660413_02698 [Salegentibacter flavus]|uniref:Uncharacterized protein n=1 Tax=Salegentibacter flavus TaxID=287099 RepID=A0A1I5C443_9FLAO|nr:hypothetical protein SAMN05660413_02698 [Salegentibacter flavus]